MARVELAVVDDSPAVALESLDELWFQVSGTVCNLRCKHCFISCAPDNHSFWFMTREQVADALEESVELGVKEYYFTGGEPFMNPEMEEILAETLALGPATVLTNATLIPPAGPRLWPALRTTPSTHWSSGSPWTGSPAR